MSVMVGIKAKGGAPKDAPDKEKTSAKKRSNKK
jgi:hypothetical protein